MGRTVHEENHEKNKELVAAAASRLFGARDPGAVDAYIGADYVQHSALAADGADGVRRLVESLPEDSGYEPVRLIADDDLVVAHGVYRGLGPQPLVGFDVFRVRDGRLVEHWDSLTPVVTRTVSGRTQTDGPTEVTEPDRSAENKALVTDWVDTVLVGGHYDVAARYVSTEGYAQHNPEAADGLDGFAAAAARWAGRGKNLVYRRLHLVVAEGEFVFTRSEGDFGVPVIFDDLWRVHDGRIVEHWDVVMPVPRELHHGNGVF